MMKIIKIKDKIYIPYDYSGKELELEGNFINNYESIFGKNSIFFQKERIKTKLGRVTIPDGFVLILDNYTWYIIEVELSEHDYYNHIIPQLTKFNDSLFNPNTRKTLIEIFYNEIQKNEDFREKADKMRKEKDLHKILTDIINKPPEIVIIIDKKKREFEGNPELKILEFTTFFSITNDNFEKIHIFDTFIEPEVNEIYHELKNEGLNQILDVTELILIQNKGYSEAANIVASKRNIHSNTVKDKCTRRLGLYTEDFLNLLKDRDKFIEILSEKFPDYKKIIHLRLNK